MLLIPQLSFLVIFCSRCFRPKVLLLQYNIIYFLLPFKEILFRGCGYYGPISQLHKDIKSLSGPQALYSIILCNTLLCDTGLHRSSARCHLPTLSSGQHTEIHGWWNILAVGWSRCKSTCVEIWQVIVQFVYIWPKATSMFELFTRSGLIQTSMKNT